jgi:hypothetical protein
MIAAVEEASIKTYKSFRWPIFMGFCVLLSMLLLRNSTVFIQFTEIYWYLSPMFAMLYRSLRHNFDGTYGKIYPGLDPDSFFEELGIEPDREKIDYYILLDELF